MPPTLALNRRYPMGTCRTTPSGMMCSVCCVAVGVACGTLMMVSMVGGAGCSVGVVVAGAGGAGRLGGRWVRSIIGRFTLSIDIIRGLVDVAAGSGFSGLRLPAQTFAGRVAFLWTTLCRSGSSLKVPALLFGAGVVAATSRLRRCQVIGGSGSGL